MMEQVLESVKKLLIEMDSKIDEMEGKNVHQAMFELQSLLLEWNLIGHNFATNGIQDWIESEKEQEEKNGVSLQGV